MNRNEFCEGFRIGMTYSELDSPHAPRKKPFDKSMDPPSPSLLPRTPSSQDPVDVQEDESPSQGQ